MKVKKNNFTENEISKALKIYNYFIENSFSNFEEKKLSKSKFNLLLKQVKKNKLKTNVDKKFKKISLFELQNSPKFLNFRVRA